MDIKLYGMSIVGNTVFLLRGLTLLALFLLGMNIPKVSLVLPLIVLPSILVLLWNRKRSLLYLDKTDILINFFLLFFSMAFYIILWFHGKIELGRALRYVITIQVLYLLGHYVFYLFSRENSFTEELLPVLSITFGFSVFVALTTSIEVFSTSSFFIFSREVSNPWIHNSIPATILSVYSCLGIALVPAAIWLLTCPPKPRKPYALINIIFLMGIVSLCSSLMLSARSTFILICGLAGISLVYIVRAGSGIFRRFSVWIFLLAVFLLALVLIPFFTDLSYFSESKIPILDRLSKNNLGDFRFRLWLEGLKHVPENLWGGVPYTLSLPFTIPFRLPSITTDYGMYLFTFPQLLSLKSSYVNYVNFPFHHNLWLDIQYFAGIIPLGLLLLFHMLHIKSLFKAISAQRNPVLGLIVLCVTISLFFYFMIEKILPGHNKIFMASCFLLAYFRQMGKAGLSEIAYRRMPGSNPDERLS